jgi:hypothetical protein
MAQRLARALARARRCLLATPGDAGEERALGNLFRPTPRISAPNFAHSTAPGQEGRPRRR